MLVRLTAKATRDFKTVIAYSSFHFGEEQAVRYAMELRAALNRLGDYPRLGKEIVYDGGSVRRVTHRYTFIYYLIEGGVVSVIKLVDARQSTAHRP